MAATHQSGIRKAPVRSSRVIQNVLPEIILIDQNIDDAGFTAFYSKLKTVTTPTERHAWDVDEFLATSDTTSAAVSSTTTTTIPVSNASYFNTGILWAVKRTGEILHVDSVNPGTGNIEVTRAVTALNSSGGTAAAAILSGDTLVKLGPAVGEESTRQNTHTTVASEVFNYTQQVRWDLQLSRRQQKRGFENGADLPYQQKKQMKEALKSLNGTLLAGERSNFTKNGEKFTTTRGMLNVPTTYTWSVGGTLSQSEWNEFLMEEGFRRGSRNKVLFSSTAVILAMTEMGLDLAQINLPFTGKSGSIGIQVLEYKSPTGGSLFLKEDRFLSDNYNGTAVGVDMNEMRRLVFNGNGISDDLQVIGGTGDADDLGHTETLYGDIGLFWGAEQNHFLITNVSGGMKGRAVL